MKPDGQNSVISFVISKRLLLESLVFRPLVKGNEGSGNEIVSEQLREMRRGDDMI